MGSIDVAASGTASLIHQIAISTAMAATIRASSGIVLPLLISQTNRAATTPAALTDQTSRADRPVWPICSVFVSFIAPDPSRFVRDRRPFLSAGRYRWRPVAPAGP